ncbi:titin-like isoform X2 [Pieris napi]|uniref:titin-like isoform X2 n=1 Tax=Pieris napi TaxID=78633 RepID=UPI001FBBFC74|nr:titin-like isoform X2 [Pieris napi]
MGDKEDYLTSYRLFFENFAANVNPEDQLPVFASDYSITEAELPGDVIYWAIEYLREKSCPATLMTPLLRIILDEVRIAAKKYPNDFGYNADKSAYKAISLMQAVIAKVNAVCMRYLDNSRLDTLPPPPRTQKEFLTVSAALRNSRRVMEDRHVEIGNLEALFDIETTEHTSFYAVYDGHAGSSAVQYCVAHLHQYLVESPNFKKDLRNALRDAFLKTDAEFIRKSKVEHRVVGGSTAVVICIRGKRLLVAWAGDSLALVAQRMRVMQLVHPHKPSREDERKRIEASGGTVMYWGTWRVNGQLAVSRAIGDAQYKPYVIAHPEQAALDLDGDEDFLVIACDGLWDVVSEDEVALAVYRQITADPNDLKAVTKRLILQAKREGSEDNISIIVVFLKDPRDIAAQNCPPMELGLDNAVVSPPLRPFDVDDKVHTVAEAAGGEDNGVSDSDSEDLGPETAVDVDADDGDIEMRNPAPPTPPAHAVEASQTDGNLVDNVAESGEDSEDEWNYFKGEGESEQTEQKSEPSEEADEAPRSETPCQDNSAWENSSVDMNSSPLNPDAPVFVPGGVAGSDVLLAESPRKPLPMEDIIVPDVKQFETEAGGRPAELQDLDNCDQLNGHHNISIEGVTAHLNGNMKCDMDSFEFNGLESEKIKDSSLIQDFERIQKDTTDFCNIQVFQTQSETNPFSIEGNNDLFERLKNKERDPMSMSFYQEKDDDTCERFSKLESQVDLNSVQLLPDSDDEDTEQNGDCQHVEDKENVHPDQHNNLFSLTNNDMEPNNDILRFDDRNDITENNVVDENVECNVEFNNMQNYSNVDFEYSNQENVIPTDTPESHKLLFEQIPEIPDGKSSELGFSNDDLLDPSESEKDNITPQDLSQDDEMEMNQEDTEMQNDIPFEANEHMQTFIEHSADIIEKESEFVSELESDNLTPEPTETTNFNTLNSEGIENNIIVDVHQSEKDVDEFETENKQYDSNDLVDNEEAILDNPKITLDSGEVPIYDTLSTKTPEPVDFITQSPLPELDGNDKNITQKEDSVPGQSPLPDDVLSKSPEPSEAVSDRLMFGDSSVIAQSPLPSQSPIVPEEVHSPIPPQDIPLVPAEVPLPRESPAPSESSLMDEPEHRSPLPVENSILQPLEEPVQKDLPLETSALESEFSLQELGPSKSPEPLMETVSKESFPTESPLPVEESVLEDTLSINQNTTPRHSPFPIDDFVPRESPLLAQKESLEDLLTRDSPITERESVVAASPVPVQESVVTESPVPVQESVVAESPIPEQELLTSESPIPIPELVVRESPAPSQELNTRESPVPLQESEARESPIPVQESVGTESPVLVQESVARESPILLQESEVRESPIPEEQPLVKTPLPDIRDSIPQDVPVESLGDSVLPNDVVQNDLLVESCVAVTSAIPNLEEQIRPATTPPPTPAILIDQTQSDAPIAASLDPLAATALAGAVAAAAAATAAVTSSKTAVKKPSLTPTARPKTAPKTPAKSPALATKRPTSSTTPRTTAPKAPTPTLASAKPSPKASSPTKAAKPLAAAAAKTAPRLAAARPATKAPAPKPPTAAKTTSAAPKPSSAAAPKPPSAAPKPLSAAPRAPAAKPAPRPATAKPAAPAPKPPAPITRPAPISARTVAKTTTAAKTTVAAPKPKAPEKKPLTNGDVKPAAKPAPKAAPAARSAPRPAPRVPAAAPAKPAAAKPTRTVLDKQSKDLANKRITAKTAPPRTAPAKSNTANKTAVKSVPRKELAKPEIIPNGINGSEEVSKPPSSPPMDNALLPDVIA